MSAKGFNDEIGLFTIADVNLLWEPLSHSERINTYRRMLGGSTTGIFDGDVGPALFEDIQIIRPTSIVSVPRFWNVLHSEYQKILSLMMEKNPKMDLGKCENQVRKISCLHVQSMSII
jgi:long-subunit acyl-CoA synthetase (AMP-forming)